MSPFKSDDLTTVIEISDEEFIVLRSPESAEHDPDYHELERFRTRQQAEAHLAHIQRLMGG